MAPSVHDLIGRFEGRFVVLEPLALSHVDALFAAAHDQGIFTWFPADPSGSLSDMRAMVAAALAAAEAGREVPFVVCDAAGGEPIGSTRFLEIRLEHLRAEIGFTWLTPRAWGTGANVEAKLMLLAHAFERVGLRRVEFKTDARNERSRGALLALGAQFEGIFRKHMVVRDGARRDSAYYSVIDDDWPALAQQLERRLRSYSVSSSALPPGSVTT
jgi:RimJ/RimL family protein N-acetyltransferase